MARLKRLIQLLRNYGFGFLLFRVWYAFERKSGLQQRKFRMRSWEQVDPFPGFRKMETVRTGVYFFTSQSLPQFSPNRELLQLAGQVNDNTFQYFFHHQYSLGSPPDWFLNPLTGKHARSDVHWTQIQDLDPQLGDIKYIWEPSRFAWVYTLVRAWAATHDDQYVGKFWQLFEHWLEKNPPNCGPNYYCGQECAIRTMAMTFAWYALNDHVASTPTRKKNLLKAIYAHAERIDKNIAYAISTRTNHALSESLGIYTVGLLFPDFKKASRWRRRGKRLLVREALKQIAGEGSYIQHSMNYHRFMLQCLLWSVRLGQLNDDAFPQALLERLDAANRFAFQLQDAVSGRVPNYGPNDGAIILPLNDCDYLDYRPVIQAVHYLLHQEKLYDNGPWDQDLQWLFGWEKLEKASPVPQYQHNSQAFSQGGYYTLRGNESWGMVRCHTYKTRPSHSDSLHLDVWYRGVNILRDSGSYLYNNPGPLKLFFSHTQAHNTVRIDHENQMTRGPRFIWYDWLEAGGQDLSVNSHVRFSGEHYGYGRLQAGLVHKRQVDLDPKLDLWRITDTINGEGEHAVQLYWQLPDVKVEMADQYIRALHNVAPFTLFFQYPNATGLKLVQGSETELLGFESLYYGEKHPAPVLCAELKAQLPVTLVTWLLPG